MVLTDAIRTAKTEHVVYFLLAAYVETLDYFDPLRSSLPESVKKLPIDGKADVVERLRALRAATYEHARREPRTRLLLDEAAAVFTSASQRLRALQNTNHEFRRESQALLAAEPYARKTVPWMHDQAWESGDRNETSARRERDRSRDTLGVECRGAQSARPRKTPSTRVAHD